jgi:hypothetical protein
MGFDLVRLIGMDEVGVERAPEAFYTNDPYYPRLRKQDEQDRRLLHAFKARFVEGSARLSGGGELEALSELFREEAGGEG